MKKVTLILLCFTILGVVISCNKNDKMPMKPLSYNNNSIDEIQSIEEAPNSGSEQQASDNSIDNSTKVSSVDYSDFNNLPQNYLQVIKSEKSFLFMGEEVLIDNYKSPYLQKYLTQCDNVQYAVLDMDSDGEVEVLISGWTSDILVLHEENGSIYGFDFTFRGMYSVRTDGSYFWNANQGNTYGCSKLSFENGMCFVVELGRVEHSDDGNIDFFVNGVRVAKDEYDSFAKSFSDVDNITWYKLSIFPKNIEDKG